MDKIEEIWKAIEEYGSKYEVSNLSRIRRTKDEFVLKPSAKGGFAVLRVNKIQKYVKIVNLVVEYFLPAPKNDNFVLVRINYLRDDNRACNLKWVTKKERTIIMVINMWMKK